MKMLKFQYVCAMMLMIWSFAINVAVAISPIVFAIIFSILEGPAYLFILLLLLFTVPLGLMMISFLIQETQETKKNYEWDKKLYEMNGLK